LWFRYHCYKAGANPTFFAVGPAQLDVDRFEVAFDRLALVDRSARRVLRPGVPLQTPPVVRGGAVLVVLVVVGAIQVQVLGG